MEQLCLCSVMLNQFLLNSKLKLGFHHSLFSSQYLTYRTEERLMTATKLMQRWEGFSPELLSTLFSVGLLSVIFHKLHWYFCVRTVMFMHTTKPEQP